MRARNRDVALLSASARAGEDEDKDSSDRDSDCDSDSDSDSSSDSDSDSDFPNTPVKRTPARLALHETVERFRRSDQVLRTALPKAQSKPHLRGSAKRVPVHQRARKLKPKGRTTQHTPTVSPSPARVALHETAKAMHRIYSLHKRAAVAVHEEEEEQKKKKKKKMMMMKKKKKKSANTMTMTTTKRPAKSRR